jgi:hypothetical protein
MDGILYVLRNQCQWKIDVAKGSMVQVRHVIEDSNSGQYLRYLKDYGLDC